MRQHRFKIYWDVIRLALDPVCFFSTRLGVCVCAVFVCCICKNEKWESTTLNVIPHIQHPPLSLSLSFSFSVCVCERMYCIRYVHCTQFNIGNKLQRSMMYNDGYLLTQIPWIKMGGSFEIPFFFLLG